MSFAGAVGAYFLDPEEGSRRRNQAAGRAGALLRRGGAEVAAEAHHVENRAAGAAHALQEKVGPSADPVEPPADESMVRAPVTAEEPVAEAEAPPDERAARGEGRSPAPFGSSEPSP